VEKKLRIISREAGGEAQHMHGSRGTSKGVISVRRGRTIKKKEGIQSVQKGKRSALPPVVKLRIEGTPLQREEYKVRARRSAVHWEVF